ncbi:uncharacterized protein LOC129602201 [Paramacrobiotus metropolitanus]|uniref:uncharacterized protein LOC129602201 n=1 Tax=Paramacrobiotus metropolitanus TaxID=2943436 RepID=UPI0024457EFD|nr:uncharacterized protein LOC129602201 [Paramacrobiotus metropolitanus]
MECAGGRGKRSWYCVWQCRRPEASLLPAVGGEGSRYEDLVCSGHLTATTHADRRCDRTGRRCPARTGVRSRLVRHLDLQFHPLQCSSGKVTVMDANRELPRLFIASTVHGLRSRHS